MMSSESPSWPFSFTIESSSTVIWLYGFVALEVAWQMVTGVFPRTSGTSGS